ncbi:hypothetical protein VP01_3983g1 [Puccinia sorghi]|uniref:Uncharacterized protein n=1 Tax=Puccinia sorghi TaxID=27349 RepID=A0A0L6UU50_9BASI|nr:hypothetical protein VP01_3983g1 [Puccinia sorghi]
MLHGEMIHKIKLLNRLKTTINYAVIKEVWNIQMDSANHFIDDPNLQERLMMSNEDFNEKFSNLHLINNKGLNDKIKKFGIRKQVKYKNIQISMIRTDEIIAESLTKASPKSSILFLAKAINPSVSIAFKIASVTGSVEIIIFYFSFFAFSHVTVCVTFDYSLFSPASLFYLACCACLLLTNSQYSQSSSILSPISLLKTSASSIQPNLSVTPVGFFISFLPFFILHSSDLSLFSLLAPGTNRNVLRVLNFLMLKMNPFFYIKRESISSPTDSLRRFFLPFHRTHNYQGRTGFILTATVVSIKNMQVMHFLLIIQVSCFKLVCSSIGAELRCVLLKTCSINTKNKFQQRFSAKQNVSIAESYLN